MIALVDSSHFPQDEEVLLHKFEKRPSELGWGLQTGSTREHVDLGLSSLLGSGSGLGEVTESLEG